MLEFNESRASLISGTLLGVALVGAHWFGARVQTSSFEYSHRGVVIETYHQGGFVALGDGGSYYTLTGGGDLGFRQRRSQQPRVLVHLGAIQVQEVVEFAVKSGLAEGRPIRPTDGIIDAGETVLSLTLSRYESPARSEWGAFTETYYVTAPLWRLQYEPDNRRVAAIAALTAAFKEMKARGSYVAPEYPDSFLGDHEETYWDDPPGPWRGVRKGKFRSYAWPELTVDVDNRLSYLGSDRYVQPRNRVERHHWIEGSIAAPKAMLIIRFESMLDHVERWQRYQAKDFPDAVRAEAIDPMFSCVRGFFLHDVVEFDWHDSFSYARPLHSIQTTSFLKDRGFSRATRYMVSRFVHVGEINPRSRMTILYLQPLPTEAGPRRAVASHKRVLADSLSAIRIKDCRY